MIHRHHVTHARRKNRRVRETIGGDVKVGGGVLNHESLGAGQVFRSRCGGPEGEPTAEKMIVEPIEGEVISSDLKTVLGDLIEKDQAIGHGAWIELKPS